MSVLLYIRKRLFFLIIVLLGLTIITFTLTKLVPINPAILWSGDRASPDVIAKIEKEFGLDKPVIIQYFHYLRNILRGNFGKSIITKHDVLDDIKQYFPATLELVIIAWIIALLVGLPLGILSSVKANTKLDHLSRIFALSGVSLPIFWLGLLFQIVFFKILNIFPLQGRVGTMTSIFNPVEKITGMYVFDSLLTGNWAFFWDSLWHLLLPSLSLSLMGIALVTRMTRSCMLEILNEDYILMAKAYGLPNNKIHFKYALKNALVPIITIVALAIGNNFLGAILIETVFDWPGIGKYVVRSILAADFTPIMGVTLVIGTIYVLLNLIVDILYAIIDPRIIISTKKE